MESEYDDLNIKDSRSDDGNRCIDLSESHRLKESLAASRNSMLLHAKELDAVRNQMRELEAEGQAQRQIVDGVQNQIRELEMENQTLRQFLDTVQTQTRELEAENQTLRQFLDTVQTQTRELEAENQTLRQLADQWVDFQRSRMSRFHRAYIYIHQIPVIGSMVKAIKQPFIALLYKKS